MTRTVPPPEVLSPSQHRVLRYWQSLCGDRRLPARRDIDPASLAEALPVVSLVDVIGGHGGLRYRSRLVGTEIVERFGREITGRRDEEYYHADYLPYLRTAYDGVVESGRPMLFRCMPETTDGVRLEYTRLVLPLASDGEAVDMLLCVFAFEGERFQWQERVAPGRSRWEEIA